METNETQNIQLAKIDERIIAIQEKQTEILLELKSVASKKIDREIFDMSLRSQSKRDEKICISVDKAWDEIMKLKISQAGIVVKIGIAATVLATIVTTVVGVVVNKLVK